MDIIISSFVTGKEEEVREYNLFFYFDILVILYGKDKIYK